MDYGASNIILAAKRHPQTKPVKKMSQPNQIVSFNFRNGAPFSCSARSSNLPCYGPAYAVNFINVKRVFFIRIFCQSQNITRKRCQKILLYEKSASKTLMKLTHGVTREKKLESSSLVTIKSKKCIFERKMHF
jgi:hypothetical protein